METELKPCPFCGGEADIGKYGEDVGITFYFICCTCGAELDRHTVTEKAAIEAWNRRADDD